MILDQLFNPSSVVLIGSSKQNVSMVMERFKKMFPTTMFHELIIPFKYSHLFEVECSCEIVPNIGYVCDFSTLNLEMTEAEFIKSTLIHAEQIILVYADDPASILYYQQVIERVLGLDPLTTNFPIIHIDNPVQAEQKFAWLRHETDPFTSKMNWYWHKFIKNHKTTQSNWFKDASNQIKKLIHSDLDYCSRLMGVFGEDTIRSGRHFGGENGLVQCRDFMIDRYVHAYLKALDQFPHAKPLEILEHAVQILRHPFWSESQMRTILESKLNLHLIWSDLIHVRHDSRCKVILSASGQEVVDKLEEYGINPSFVNDTHLYQP